MELNKENNKRYVGLVLALMVILSVTVAWIMAKNLKKDTSQLRHKLTVDYKKYKEIDYVYDEKKGQRIYSMSCMQCHGAQGQGTYQAPPLAKNKYITQDSEWPLKVTIKGLQGELERAGKIYNSSMPSYKILPHTDLAHALNFIRNNFGNKAATITTVDVIKAKVKHVEQKGPWKTQEM